MIVKDLKKTLDFLKLLRKDCEQLDLGANGRAHNASGTSAVSRVDWAESVVSENHELLASTLGDLSDSMLAVSHTSLALHSCARFTMLTWRDMPTALPASLDWTKRTCHHGGFTEQSRPCIHLSHNHFPPAIVLLLVFWHESPGHHRYLQDSVLLLGGVRDGGYGFYYHNHFVCL